jgi:hypothetical protein
MAEGQRHSDLSALAPLMSRQAVAYYELHLVGGDQEAIAERDLSRARWARAYRCGPDHAALTRISALVTGVDGVDTPERTERFRDLVLILSAATTGSFSTKPQGDMIRAGKAAMAALVDEYLQASLDRRIDLVRRHRAAEVEKEALPRDMLTSLCLQDDTSHADDSEKIPYVWRQCALFLTGSIKTTSHSLPHVFVHPAEWLRSIRGDKEKLTDPEFLHRAAAGPSTCIRPRRAVPTPRDGRFDRPSRKGEIVAPAPPTNGRPKYSVRTRVTTTLGARHRDTAGG